MPTTTSPRSMSSPRTGSRSSRKKPPNYCPGWGAHCASGWHGPATSAPAANYCGRCLRSKGGRAWAARWGWGGGLGEWVARPGNLGARSELLRALHTLKGSSRLAGAMRLGEMAHRLESAIEQFDPDTVTAEQIEPLQGNFDGLQ